LLNVYDTTLTAEKWNQLTLESGSLLRREIDHFLSVATTRRLARHRLSGTRIGAGEIVMDRSERADWFATPWVWVFKYSRRRCFLSATWRS
jgi:hypothetical protein